MNMDARDFFINLISTDANCPVDVFAHKYSREDLFKFAEAYYKEKLLEELNEDIDIGNLGWPLFFLPYDGTEDGDR